MASQDHAKVGPPRAKVKAPIRTTTEAPLREEWGFRRSAVEKDHRLASATAIEMHDPTVAVTDASKASVNRLLNRCVAPGNVGGVTDEMTAS